MKSRNKYKKSEPKSHSFNLFFSNSYLSNRLYRFIHAKHTGRLGSIMKDFIKMYPVQPKQLTTHEDLLKNEWCRGHNGIIYDSGLFQNQPIITKINFKQHKKLIHEIYINMVMINSLLLKQIGTDFLVPTYGLFICPVSTDFSSPSLCWVQPKLDGQTLHSLLKKGLSIENAMYYMKLIFSHVMELESCVYQIYHQDLHTKNIMVCQEKVYLIDFGLSNAKGTHTRISSHPHTLSYTKNKNHVDGVMDIYLLLMDMYSISLGSLQDWIKEKVTLLLSLFTNEKGMKATLTMIEQFDKKHLLYIMLAQLEKSNTSSHELNLNQLIKYKTYDSLKTFLFPEW